MSERIDVTKIVEKYLKENGFDGLYHDGDCACQIGYLGPCEHLCLDCEPGYKTETPDGEFDYVIGKDKPQ